MANSQKGEFALTMGGTAYTLKIGTAALVRLQERFGTPEHVPTIMELQREVVRGRALYIQAFMWAGLQRYHPEVTFDEVGDLIDDTEEADLRPLLEALGVTLVPDPADVQALGLDTPHPPQAQTRPRGKARRNGGGRSTSTDVARV